jgi:hypothetical protein
MSYGGEAEAERLRQIHEDRKCQCPPSNWCGDVIAWPGVIGEPSTCFRCMKHDPHEHR